MFRIIALLAGLLMIGLAASTMSYAQEAVEDDSPDYQVINTAFSVSPDETEIVVTFSVYNSGGTATQQATAHLTEVANSNNILVEAIIEPLAGGGGNVTGVPIRFPVTLFEPNETVTMSVLVTLDEEDQLDTLDNAATVQVSIPDYDPAAVRASQQQPETTSSDPEFDLRSRLWWLDIGIDLNNGAHLALLAVFGVMLMLIAYILKLFLSLFRRSPSFGNWHPPYATMPPLDPNSTYGRRQAWQQHAQNNTVPLPCKGGVIHPRKVLMGMDGNYLSGWKIIALRMTQYDMYGRVSRSQVMASGSMIRRLNRVARKLNRLDERKIGRRVRPVAKGLAKQFKKKINKRSAMLPVAVDLRLRGTHGEVRIVFELYDCLNGHPRRIDYWEPEMTVVGKTIYESYTYTVYGQSGNEKFKAFRKRLPTDIERILVEMLQTHTEKRSEPTHVGPAADTLTGTQPIARVEVDNTADTPGGIDTPEDHSDEEEIAD